MELAWMDMGHAKFFQSSTPQQQHRGLRLSFPFTSAVQGTLFVELSFVFLFSYSDGKSNENCVFLVARIHFLTGVKRAKMARNMECPVS